MHKSLPPPERRPSGEVGCGLNWLKQCIIFLCPCQRPSSGPPPSTRRRIRPPRGWWLEHMATPRRSPLPETPRRRRLRGMRRSAARCFPENSPESRRLQVPDDLRLFHGADVAIDFFPLRVEEYLGRDHLDAEAGRGGLVLVKPCPGTPRRAIRGAVPFSCRGCRCGRPGR